MNLGSDDLYSPFKFSRPNFFFNFCIQDHYRRTRVSRRSKISTWCIITCRQATRACKHGYGSADRKATGCTYTPCASRRWRAKWLKCARSCRTATISTFWPSATTRISQYSKNDAAFCWTTSISNWTSTESRGIRGAEDWCLWKPTRRSRTTSSAAAYPISWKLSKKSRAIRHSRCLTCLWKRTGNRRRNFATIFPPARSMATVPSFRPAISFFETFSWILCRSLLLVPWEAYFFFFFFWEIVV